MIQAAVLALFTPLGWAPVTQFLPAAVSLAYLAKLWWAGELNGVQQAVFVAWFLAAAALQFASHGAWIWIAGFVGQVALIIALVLKNRMDEI